MPCQHPNCLGCEGFDLDVVIAQRIAENGWMAMWITDPPQFCYTIGLTEQKKPELIVTAQLGGNRFNRFLAAAVKLVHDGTALSDGMVIDGLVCQFKAIKAEHKESHMGKAINRYGEDFEALQIVVNVPGNQALLFK